MTDKSALLSSLDQAVLQTLETMCFTEASVADSEETHERHVYTTVDFRGDAAGTVQIEMPERTAQDLASCFLGTDPSELARTQIDSVCGEIANMICGAMVSLACPDGSFDLEAPAVSDSPGSLSTNLSRTYAIDSAFIRVGVACPGLH